MRVSELVCHGKVIKVVRPGHCLQQYHVPASGNLTLIGVDVSSNRGGVGLERILCDIVDKRWANGGM